jgi:hypothetical protein
MAAVAQARLTEGVDDPGFYKAKLDTARFFMTKVLPESGGLFAQIMAGSAPLMQFEDAAF